MKQKLAGFVALARPHGRWPLTFIGLQAPPDNALYNDGILKPAATIFKTRAAARRAIKASQKISPKYTCDYVIYALKEEATT